MMNFGDFLLKNGYSMKKRSRMSPPRMSKMTNDMHAHFNNALYCENMESVFWPNHWGGGGVVLYVDKNKTLEDEKKKKKRIEKSLEA